LKITTATLKEKKEKGEKITMLTAYGYPTARILDEADIDVVLVGDSLGMVVLGYETTIPVTLEDMLHHTKAVRRGVQHAMLVSDMPFMTYETDKSKAIENSGRLMKEGGAEGIKVEGGAEIAEIVSALVKANIPVMGHLGLTPQAIHRIGGYKVQGKTDESRQKIIADAKLLEDAGIFALVLECVPESLAEEITAKISVPTIGIGAGRKCDGQVLVTNDMLGMNAPGFQVPKFVKKYADLTPEIKKAVEKFRDEVKQGEYPDKKHTYE